MGGCCPPKLWGDISWEPVAEGVRGKLGVKEEPPGLGGTNRERQGKNEA